MKTVIFNTETKIIKGFGNAEIDPVETVKKITPLLSESKEFKEFKVKQAQMQSLGLAYNQAKFDNESVFFISGKRNKLSDREISFMLSTNVLALKEKFDAKEIESYEKTKEAMSRRQSEMTILMESIRENSKLIENKRLSLIEENAVYFGTASYEKVLTDLEFKELSDKVKDLSKGQTITVDGEVIDLPKVVEEVKEK